MSQRRLIVSLALISSCLALVIALAAWTFPLKAQGVAGGSGGGVPGGVAQGISRGVAQSIANGIAGGVSNGIAGGISGGISGGVSTRLSADEPSVDISTIWADTVKKGPMPLRQVRLMGTLVREEGSTSFVARVTVPASQSGDLKQGQNAAVSTQKGPLAKGHVSSVGAVSNDTRTVDIAIDGPAPPPPPPGAVLEPGKAFEVSATIDIGQLDDVLLFIGRPVNSVPNNSIKLFKIINNGAEGVRTQVKLGRASASTIEVLDGLKEGDKVILSDMSSVAYAERIRLTDENRILKH